jgi:hypothetical protein
MTSQGRLNVTVAQATSGILNPASALRRKNGDLGRDGACPCDSRLSLEPKRFVDTLAFHEEFKPVRAIGRSQSYLQGCAKVSGKAGSPGGKRRCGAGASLRYISRNSCEENTCGEPVLLSPRQVPYPAYTWMRYNMDQRQFLSRKRARLCLCSNVAVDFRPQS